MTDLKDQEKKVNEYIKKYLKKGYPKDSLKKTLLDFGYDKRVVDKAFNTSEPKKPTSERLTQIREPLDMTKLKWLWYSLASVLIIIILISIVLLFLDKPKDCQYDKQCFIENAKQGNYVVVQEDVAGSTLQFSYKDDSVTKEFVSFAEDEPEEIVVLFQGKKIVCPFYTFDEDILNGVFGGSESCTGDLLDIVYELNIIS